MKKFLKILPLTSYAAIIVIVILLFVKDIQRDELLLTDPVFWIFILSIPLIGIGQFYSFLGIKASLPWTILVCFFLDICLYFFKKLILRIKSKLNKKTKQ